jgi:hypothetical protein
MHIFATKLGDHFNTFISFAPSISEFPSVMIHISFLAAVPFRVKSVYTWVLNCYLESMWITYAIQAVE